MAHTPQDPGGAVVDQNLTEVTEIYLCPIGTTLGPSHLLEQTTGAVDAAPTRQVTRTTLHNLSDIVSVGALQSQPFTIQVFLPKSHTVMGYAYDSYEGGSYVKLNVFHRDGSGFMGYGIVTQIQPTTDPSANSFSQQVTIEPFNMVPIPA